MINIYDKILIVILVVTALSFNFIIKNITTRESIDANDEHNDTVQKVVVTINNEIYETYDLTKDDSYTVQNGKSYNRFKVQEGYVKMIDANCNDKLCLSRREISGNFETIVCLPHKLIIEVDSKIDGNNEIELDSISQ